MNWEKIVSRRLWIVSISGSAPSLSPRGMHGEFAEVDRGKVRMSEVRVSAAGQVAWLTEKCVFEAMVSGKPYKLDGRMTAVLENRKGRWHIGHSHFFVSHQE